jgi:dipeptidyl aminopeptidase/acylaminoacyl peptidase
MQRMLSRNHWQSAAVVAFLMAASAAFGQRALATEAKRPITVEDLWALKRPGAPALSPDGRWAAVEVTSYDMEENSSASDIWLLSTDGASARQLTAHVEKDSAPAWSPDGKWIAFLTKREGDEQPQVYLISPEGGEARRLTRIPSGASGIRWFADSRRLLFISWVWPELKSDEEQAARLKEMKEAKVKAYVIETTNYRYWDRWLADGRVPRLFAADIESGQHADVLAPSGLSLPRFDPSAEHYDIAPDGSEVAITTDLGKDPGYAPNSEVVVVSLIDGTWRNLTADNPAADFLPRYSPDGRWIAYAAATIRSFSADGLKLQLYDRTSGARRVLAGGWDRSPASLAWSPDGRRLYFTAEDRARQPLWSLELDGAEPRPLIEGGTVAPFAVSREGGTIAYVRTSMGRPPQVFAAAEDGSDERKIETFNDALIARWKLGEVRDVQFEGYGDAPVQMWVIQPPDFNPREKWPLLQVVHGGPHGAWMDQFHFRWNMHLLASRGHVVAAVNFHGSTGWGLEFTDSNTGEYGKKELADIERATDHLIAEGSIDPNRLAAAGASYGGYMVAFMNGHTDRYRAYVCHAGVFDWVAQMGSDVVRGRDRALGAFPWEDPERVLRQSAHTYARSFKTPTLVIHGELDYRVPVTQGFQYYTTLRMLDVPSRLLYFAGENHWILKPQASRLWHREVFGWIERYIGAGPSWPPAAESSPPAAADRPADRTR